MDRRMQQQRATDAKPGDQHDARDAMHRAQARQHDAEPVELASHADKELIHAAHLCNNVTSRNGFSAPKP
jgi:hypothetical protein